MLRWWWLIVLAAVVAAVSAYYFLRDQPEMYQSSTTIMVGESLEDPNPNSAEIGLAQQLAQAYAEIAVRAPLRQAVRMALGLDVMPEYTVEAREDSSLLEIAVDAAEPAVAQAVAREIVNQLILLSPTNQIEEGRQGFIDDQLTKLEDDIRVTEEEIELKQSELGSLFSARDISDAQQQINALENKERSLRTSYSELLQSAQRNAVNRITVLEPAALPLHPMPSDTPRNILLAAMMGIVLGATGAYLLEFFDDSVRDGDRMRKQLGAPMLASIPTQRTKDGLVMASRGRTPAAESYRELRTNLLLAVPDLDSACFVMASPTPNDGKSSTAANLGIAMAQAGKRVIIVDADLHRPRQQIHFSVSNRVGLSTILKDRSVDIGSVIQTTGHPGLSIVTSGPLPQNASEFLASSRMSEVLAEFRKRADAVLIDSPPVLALVDAVVLSTQADGVVLVLRVGKTRRSAAMKVSEMMEQVNSHIVGFVLNGVPRRQSTYGRAYGYDKVRNVDVDNYAVIEEKPQTAASSETQTS